MLDSYFGNDDKAKVVKSKLPQTTAPLTNDSSSTPIVNSATPPTTISADTNCADTEPLPAVAEKSEPFFGRISIVEAIAGITIACCVIYFMHSL